MGCSHVPDTEEKVEPFIPHSDHSMPGIETHVYKYESSSDSILGEGDSASPALGPGKLGKHHPSHARLGKEDQGA